MWGRVLQAVTRNSGTSTVGVEAVGQTVISVDSLRDFVMDTGFVVLDEEVLVGYNAVDRVNGTLTLVSALTTELPAGTDVVIYPVSTKRMVFVEPNAMDEPTDAIWCTVPHALAAFIAADGPREAGMGEVVDYQIHESSFIVTDVKDRQPFLQPSAVPDGLITETMVSPEAITTPLLASNAVATRHLQFGSATGDVLSSDALNGKTITGALIRTAAEGKRLELTTSGLIQLDSAGNVILSIGDTNKFTGEVDATSINIRDSLQLFGRNNLFAVGSKVTLRSSTSAPAQSPTLSWEYEPGPVINDYLSGTSGAHSTPGASTADRTGFFFNVATYRKANGAVWNFPQIPNPADSEGGTHAEFSPEHMTRVARLDNGAERVVMLGSDRNRIVNGYSQQWIRVYDDSTMLADGSVAPILKHEQLYGAFSWHRADRLGRVVTGSNRNQFIVLSTVVPLYNDGPRTLTMTHLAWSSADNAIVEVSYNNYGAVLDADETAAGGALGTRAALGLDGVGTDTVLVVMTNKMNRVYSVTYGTWDTSSNFPIVNNTQDRTWSEGVISTNTHTAFCSLNFATGTAVKTFRYANNHKVTDSVIWASYVWRGEATQSYRTTMSSQAYTAHRKMARLKVTMPSLPAPIAGVGAVRDPSKDAYGWVYFLGVGFAAPARTGMYEQAVQPILTVGTELSASSITLATYPVLSGTNPPATTTFPAAAAATIESDNGLMIISGDGKITADEFLGGAIDKLLDLILPPGVVIETADDVAPYRTLLCNGVAVSRTTYAALFNKIGTTYGVGNGSTTFNLPNRQNRVGIGANPKLIGSTGGLEDVLLTAAQSGLRQHGHSIPVRSSSYASHNHYGLGGIAEGASPDQFAVIGYTNDVAAANAIETHTNMMPFTVMNYYIRY